MLSSRLVYSLNGPTWFLVPQSSTEIFCVYFSGGVNERNCPDYYRPDNMSSFNRPAPISSPKQAFVWPRLPSEIKSDLTLDWVHTHGAHPACYECSPAPHETPVGWTVWSSDGFMAPDIEGDFKEACVGIGWAELQQQKTFVSLKITVKASDAADLSCIIPQNLGELRLYLRCCSHLCLCLPLIELDFMLSCPW